MTDITNDKWYKDMQARRKMQEDVGVPPDPPKPAYIKRTSPAQTFKPSPTLAQMQADSMARLRKRAMPPIRKEYQ